MQPATVFVELGGDGDITQIAVAQDIFLDSGTMIRIMVPVGIKLIKQDRTTTTSAMPATSAAGPPT